MTRPADRVTKERLERLDLANGLSTTELAERLGSNRESVRKLPLKHAIPLRPRSYLP